MDQWLIVWEHIGGIARGSAVTLFFFVCGSAIAFLLACGIAYFLDGRGGILQRTLRGLIDVFRTIPFLIVLYLLYYGLPQYGIRISAWTAGLIALSVYHAAYFAEILRGARASLPLGQSEAAQAHGFAPFKLYVRLLLPQMIFKSFPLFGNQLIICLKDTAFLSIVTVFELTAAANHIQAMYFVPMPAFVTVIAVYWAISASVELVMERLNARGRLRGLSSE